MKYVIFDFNGTILDDVDVGIKAVNYCIDKYLSRPHVTRNEYLHIFTFPIEEYYERAGFNWQGYTFSEVGKLWFDKYCEYKDEYKVYDGAIDMLIKNHELGNKNILLSASFIDALKIQLKELNIEQYFDEVIANNDIYAASKVDVGLKWIKDKNPDDCSFIGDTLHDYEVAMAMGIKNVTLVAKGHQAKDVLLKEYNNVVDDIRQVKL